MATGLAPRTMTLTEFRALPEEAGVDRELLCGELVETEFLYRNRWQASVQTSLIGVLGDWAERAPMGVEILSRPGCEIPDQDSIFGIDVAVFSVETLDAQSDESPFILGAPILAVEVISPSARHEQTKKKTDTYLRADVQAVWNIDPQFRTVNVHKPNESPRMYSGDDMIEDAVLPGFSSSVSAFFDSAVFK